MGLGFRFSGLGMFEVQSVSPPHFWVRELWVWIVCRIRPQDDLGEWDFDLRGVPGSGVKECP